MHRYLYTLLILATLVTPCFSSQIFCPSNNDFIAVQGRWGQPYADLNKEAKTNWGFIGTDFYTYASVFSPLAKVTVKIFGTFSICSYMFANAQGQGIQVSVYSSKFPDLEKIKLNKQYNFVTNPSGATNILYTCVTTAGKTASSCPIEILG